ncbi:copper amine oxidase N-terminal domain-containing protein [Paenibacillus albus]|uniref:Copper amine oxidase N-terminal domain-containing protein n=1 Tax=Paenibacillus albus TaxID=2495582 RepID=A0A3S9A7J1_9BACL|nr:copper amine oxidase N-terminal domain-containing protein [Paenibacillus albus]AZN41673.1 copper amine oxidase N-terminal domain-containing protein [Paenibacillus albus]
MNKIKIMSGFVLAVSLSASAATAYAANNHPIRIDGVSVVSDALPEVKNSRMMVPLRVISENLGATVEWSKSVVTIKKDSMKVTLKTNDRAATKNDANIQLDVLPYVKNNRVYVPLRFIAETFNCKVNYSDTAVTVDTAPLTIDGVKVKTLQQEYHMTMGGVVQQINGNAINAGIYDILVKNKGAKVAAPASYSWSVNIDVPGSYYKNGQYDFMDAKGVSIKRFDIYSLVEAFPKETLAGYPSVLIHDPTPNEWYLFSMSARDAIIQLTDTATKNGAVKVISNTVV